jgi:hypothetical protein
MVKKTKSSPVSFSNTVNAASSEGETTTFVDQPAENNIHAGEEVVVADDPPTTPGTSADEAAADARKRSKLKTHESITSYVETRHSLNWNPFANDHLQPLRL